MFYLKNKGKCHKYINDPKIKIRRQANHKNKELKDDIQNISELTRR